MKHSPDIENILSKPRTFEGMSLGSLYEETAILAGKAQNLVKERIKGERKGLPGELNYMHSMRVYETVRKLHHWDDPDEEMFIAALLHDIVEDGNTSLQELVDMGFSRRIIELVYLCSHDMTVKNKTERWALMISKLIQVRDEEAWCIKLIDIADNLTQSRGLTEENRRFMVEVKAPLILRLTEHLDGGVYHRYRNHLQETLETLRPELKV